MTWSGHQAFCPYLFCLSQEGNNLQAADWMTDVKQDLSWPILLLASFSTTLQNWFLENKSSCYIMLYRWVAACCRSLSSWHLVLCSQSLSLSLSPSLATSIYCISCAGCCNHIGTFCFGPFRRFRRCSTMKIVLYDWAFFIIFILFDMHHTMVHHMLKG